MVNSFSLILISSIFIFVLTTYFILKKHINSLELKLYESLLISNFVGLFLEMLCFITIRYLPQYSAVTYFVNKMYLFYFVFFMTKFSDYSCLISYGEKKYREIMEKYKVSIYFVVIMTILTTIYLPININYGEVTYSYGAAVDFIYIYAFANVFLCLFLLLKNFKTIQKNKYLPLIIYIFGSGAVGLIQKAFPELTLSTTMDSILLFVMYFTIENPDMRLLEEAHKAKEISDSANEEKTLFLYNMTQEIRNITGKINEDADIILESKDFEEIYNGARDIKATTSKFNAMTNDILDVSTIDSANIKTYSSKYSIKTILKQIVNVYTDICKNKGLRFITNIDHDIPDMLYGDSIGLKEALNIILSNSVKYTSNGYIELSVNAIIKNDICRLMITIEDSGIGIKSEDINEIKKADNSIGKVNKLITLMNGTMLISSDYGKGTKVKIILDQKIEMDTTSTVLKYESNFDNIRLLSVDDKEAGLKIIDKLLKGTNIIIDKVDNGKDCIEKIRANKYDIILLDEDLSQISGLELMSKIKEIRNFNTPVILLSKDNSYEYNEEYLEVGFSDYLLKPLKKDELLDMINKYTKEDNN